VKHKTKRPTRAQLQAKGEAPTLYKCGCGFKGSKYQIKEHKGACDALR
jgi:hypothetical protein